MGLVVLPEEQCPGPEAGPVEAELPSPAIGRGKNEVSVTPLVGIVGRSGAGKTTLIERLIPELVARGYRVATIKHTPEEASLDEPGKDSWRHIQAGSGATAIRTPRQLVLIRPEPASTPLEAVAGVFGGEFDIVLAEGFKSSQVPKIEVCRRASGAPLKSLRNLVARVSDGPLPAAGGIPQFRPDDITGLADFIEKEFIRPGEPRLEVCVNGRVVPLGPFPGEVISRVLLALAASLKGVAAIRTLVFRLRPGRGG